MAAQSLLFRPSTSASSTQDLQTSKTQFSQPSSTFSFSSDAQSPHFASFKTNTSFASSLCVLRKAIKRSSKFTINAEKKIDTRISRIAVEEDGKLKVRRKNLAVFVSGGGSNFRSIHQAVHDGSVHGEIVVLVTNNPDCGGALYARDNGIPVIEFPKTKDASNGISSDDLVSSLRTFNIDFVLLAGYLKLIPSELIQAYPRHVFNIHPSLLPAFGGKGYYGIKVHKAVIASGARYSGPTIHHVDEKYDTGRILAQRVVPVYADDTAETLAKRVLHEEHKLYVEVSAALCEDRITWREDGVPLIQSKENPNAYC